jgi:dipeptidyl aminopeptidase/acylaminoacyl peptidase
MTLRSLIFLLLALASFFGTMTSERASAATADPRPSPELDINDVLSMSYIDRAVLSPDGRTLAISVRRPVGSGEVYGRTAYEVDPSRDDIWLVSLDSRRAENITKGQSLGAGFWCPRWSGDGRRLAMLSTRPEKDEAHGGNNVRLYVYSLKDWTLARLSDRAVMNQTRYGGSMYNVSVEAEPTIAGERCSNEERAPYAWLDNERLIALLMPVRQQSPLIDEYGRFAARIAADAALISSGQEPTMSSVGAGDGDIARLTPMVTLAVMRVGQGSVSESVPIRIFPFAGSVDVKVNARRSFAAVLSASSRDQSSLQEADQLRPLERKYLKNDLSIVDLSTMRAKGLPQALPAFDRLLDWSPDGRWLAVTSREKFAEGAATLGIIDVDDLDSSISRLSANDRDQLTSADFGGSFRWISDQRFIAQARVANRPGEPNHWWIGTADGAVLRLEGTAGTFAILGDDQIALGLAAGASQTIDFKGGRVAGTTASTALTDAESAPEVTTYGGKLATIGRFQGQSSLCIWNRDAKQYCWALIAREEPQLVTPSGSLISKRTSPQGVISLVERRLGVSPRELLSFNASLASKTWPELKLVSYRVGSRNLRAIVMMPKRLPDQQPPAIVWVYPGYVAQNPSTDYWTNPVQPGIYNLNLYVARGFAVIIPSMPIDTKSKSPLAEQLLTNADAAVVAVIDAGWIDPKRVNVVGQSYGGYAVAALLSQSSRYRRGVGVSGVYDFIGFYNHFEPRALGYPGLEDQITDNRAFMPRMLLPPLSDDTVSAYVNASPLSRAGQIQAPLLLLHGELDSRTSITDSERLYARLRNAGRVVRFTRFGGENHAIARSPANVRAAFVEIVNWLSFLEESPTENPAVP